MQSSNGLFRYYQKEILTPLSVDREHTLIQKLEGGGRLVTIDGLRLELRLVWLLVIFLVVYLVQKHNLVKQ